ncbi:MAG: efflux RND transporter permease subunit [Povalibacter sp.]
MARFFIDRPVFAWVIAIIIMLAGALSITTLPISRYPIIAPPAVSVSASYPGAAAQTVQDSVTQIIEQRMQGLDGLLYMSSSSDASGGANVTLTFASGTDPDIAQVQVQNKVQQAMPLLPQIVQQQGVNVNKSNQSFLMVVGLVSDDNSMDRTDISDFASSRLVEPLSRVPGVGNVQVFGSEYAMRIWLDPDKLNTYKLTPTDVIAAIRAQNAQVSVGQLGALPSSAGQQLNATVTSQGRLQTPEEFKAIILRSNVDGSALRMSDVARVEMGSADYNFISRFNRKSAAGLAIILATDANALSTADAVRDMINKMEPTFPHGLRTVIPFDTTPFVRVSIHEVVKTLAEAIFLVFLVMWLFLQNFRATLIPTIAVPVVLLGTFGVLAAAGMSINMLTMFAMVLAIGLLVDDAIVVVENVERVMREEGLSPLEATRKSMDQITGALVGIAMVLSAVFLPMAFLSGSTGVIYRQFSITIVSAMALSVLVALVLTPALCATLLKPISATEHEARRGFFGWFNRTFERSSEKYQSLVSRMIRRTGRSLLVYVGICAIMLVLFIHLPTSFLPEEDQGVMFVQVQAPVGATQSRTLSVIQKVEDHFLQNEKESVESMFSVLGFSFGGGGQNNAIAFVKLKDWEERTDKKLGVQSIAGRAMGALMQIKDAMVFAFPPPPLPELGRSQGFSFFLQDSTSQGHDALVAARNQFLGAARQSKLLANVRPNGQEDTPQFRLTIDAQKAGSHGLSIADVNQTLSIAWGGQYIDDFLDRGRVKRVYVQSDAPFRMSPEDFDRWYVRNQDGEMVPFSAFASSHWDFGSPRLERFNGLPATEINGQPAEGVSSGDAMMEVERLVSQLPGYTVAWSGASYQERAAGSQTPLLYTLSILVVFLCLAALYESWAIPAAVMLVVPLGIVGAVVTTTLAGLQRDVYFQVAMLTTIGLASKNAVLIVEFAKGNLEKGMNLVESVMHAIRDRLRPIMMTSMAFGLGVMPLAVSTGAGAGAQRAIGTGVVGGMLAGTFLGIFFVPLFFVMVLRLVLKERRHHIHHDDPALDGGSAHV